VPIRDPEAPVQIACAISRHMVTQNARSRRGSLLEGNIRCRNELQSGNLLAPKDISEAIARKQVLRQGPDKEQVATVPCCGTDQLAWLRYRVLLVPAGRARVHETHARRPRCKATPSRYDKLVHIRWWRQLDVFGKQDPDRLSFEPRDGLIGEELQHFLRNQRLGLGGPGKRFQASRINTYGGTIVDPSHPQSTRRLRAGGPFIAAVNPLGIC
jgi:hypothetical protein